MKHTYVFSLADTLKAIPSYNWRGTLETFNFLDQVYGDKNIYTTPRDLLTWDRALTSDLIFTPETLDQAYAPYSNEKPGQHNYGLGWRMTPEDLNSGTHVILVTPQGLVGGADPREEGKAVALPAPR